MQVFGLTVEVERYRSVVMAMPFNCPAIGAAVGRG
jgi:hypothetical protein